MVAIVVKLLKKKRKEIKMPRINVTFNEKAYAALSKLEKKSGVSKSELLRNAIALLDYVEERKEQGEKLAIIKGSRVKQEIVFP
jgi:metal-responsive CopG/Arc/MetJ family transcriptional regulator